MEYKIETWSDSAGCYAMMQTDETIWMVTSECDECLSMYLKPFDDDSTWFYAEDMVFSLERQYLTEKGQEIYDALHGELVESFSSSYRLHGVKGNDNI